MLYLEASPDEFVPWTGQPTGVGDAAVTHPLNIEALWTPDELAAVGLHAPAVDPVPDGRRIVSSAVQRVDGVVRRVDAYEDTPPAVPDSITARQGKIRLLRMGLMTSREATEGSLPAFLSAVAANMPAAEAAELAITWRDAVNWERTDPLFGGSLLAAASAALGQEATGEAVDQFFREAALI